MKLLKAYHEIILRDVILLDATKSAKTLKKYWFIPLFLCRKELEQLAEQIFDAIGGQTVENLGDDFDKLLSYRKIQLLEALYKAVQIEIGLKPRINAWKIILEKDYKESPQLEEVLSEVKRFTDIDIQSPEDVKTLFDYIQHKIHKHEEMFPDPDAEMHAEIILFENSEEYRTSTDKQRNEVINEIRARYNKGNHSIVEVLNSVFHYFNLQPNENMLLITWVGMKTTAEAQSKQSNNQDNGQLE